ncbi:LapA family protein [Neisseriaceae bacterium B1]
MKPIHLIIKVIVLIFFLILALINTQKVPFSYVPGQEIQLPLIAILFGAFIIGTLFGIFAMFGRLLRLRNENSRLRAEVQKSARLATQDIAAPVQTNAPAATNTQPENK